MNFYLYLSTPWPVPQATTRFQDAGILAAFARRLNPMGVFTYITDAPGVTIELQQVLQYSKYRAALERDLALRASLKLVFHVSEFEYEKEGQYAGVTSMLNIASQVLQAAPGDAVMLTEKNELLLQRRNEQLLVNTEWSFWTPYRLSKVGLPYKLRELPSALSA